jgi:hypothetical protein
MSHTEVHKGSPPIFIHSISTNYVLEIEGGVAKGKLRVDHQKKAKNDNQLWIIEENGIISCAADRGLVIEYQHQKEGSPVVAGDRKDDLHNWNQLWELHRGFIRSMTNHNLVLDVVHRSASPGAPVCVFKPHKTGNHENQQWGLLTKTGTPYAHFVPSPTKFPRGKGFDPSKVEPRLTKLWNHPAVFGHQATPDEIFHNEIVSDRYCLINGVQALRDEIQLGFEKGGALMQCAIDLTLPTVVTSLAHTNCGDRINHIFHDDYTQMVASRFANIAMNGSLKVENFSPAGGGTDDGGVLAHVTVGHQLDNTLRQRIYEGNKSSYVLVNIDLMTHVGCDLAGGHLSFGSARESAFREARSACGAIIATITAYDNNNVVHNRLKRNLGDTNFNILKQGIKLPSGTDITFVVAAAIIAIQGLRDTCFALANELDERGVAHVTASTTINGTNNLFYFGRATVFGGLFKIQGFGLDASKYSGSIKEVLAKKYLVLTYDGKPGDQLEVETIEYTVKSVPSAPEH